MVPAVTFRFFYLFKFWMKEISQLIDFTEESTMAVHLQ
jgi:hypothetical protein